MLHTAKRTFTKRLAPPPLHDLHRAPLLREPDGTVRALNRNGAMHVDETNGAMHAIGMNDVKNVDETDGMKHVDETNGAMHAIDANGAKHVDETNGAMHAIATNGAFVGPIASDLALAVDDDIDDQEHSLTGSLEHSEVELSANGSSARTSIVSLELAVLAKNDALAERNRVWFAQRGIVALNLVSSPGSGKTTLLERTIRDCGAEFDLTVIEGDQATARDGERVRAAGARAVQVNTGTGCHLEAQMIADALHILQPDRHSVLVVENVGNLVCPALFDLGERAKVAIISVTEGDDKPEKYPHMFAASELVIINKIDLLPYVDFSIDRCKAAARALRADISIIELSARTGEGMDRWYDWIRAQRLAPV